MKNIFKYILIVLLSFLSRGVIRRYRPSIVMITGSVGKTSTKDAVAAVLSSRFLVRKSEKSFNSEFGVPFTILGVENPWNNPFEWVSVFKKALTLLLLPNHYPKMLVLEVGADGPGDIARTLRLTSPDVVVVTRLPDIPVHVEAYTSPEAVREEEFLPAYSLRVAAPLILCADDPYAMDNAARSHARLITYGSADTATVQIGKIDFLEKDMKVVGMSADVFLQSEHKKLTVFGSVGGTQILPAAAALATAVAFDIPISSALEALEAYIPPPGRGRLLQGVKDSVLIDDSYNSSPVAVEQALATLKRFPSRGGRRIAVLGDMLELGRYSVSEHERIGALARKSADVVIGVGIRARAFACEDGATEVRLFDNSETAASALLKEVKSNDLILIKGSQSIRMEKIVETLLDDPQDASLLVRQDKRWKRKM